MATTIIDASAGSGKTYQLAVAYLKALLQPLPDGSPTLPQQVLATTFTRAAASEILERVLLRLAEAVVSEEKRRSLLADIGHPELGRDDLATLLASICQALPQLQIGTIDGLFARMVRVMGLDLAFPPAWTIADEAQTKDIALDAADRMLNGPEVHLALGPWQRYVQFKPFLRMRAALADLLEENRFLLIDASTVEDNPALVEPRRLEPDAALRIVQALEAFDLPRTKGKKPEPHKSWVKAIEQLKAVFQSEIPLIGILNGHTLVRLAHEPNGSYYKVPIPENLREILAPVIQEARADLLRLHEARLPALAALARRYHEFRRALAYASATYRFPEVEAAVRMLPEHFDWNDLYFRLDGRVQHLLLDEFQDTSINQFRFLWRIIEEIVSNRRLFFAVGDVKQSIYGWRGADRHLLTQLPGWLKSREAELEHKTLSDNYRSSPVVLDALNRLFIRLDQRACLDPGTYSDPKDQDRARVHQQAAATFIKGYEPPIAKGENRHLAGRVRLQVTQSVRTGTVEDDEESSDEIETIISVVVQHREEDPHREIAVLCRRRKWIPTLIARLRRLHIEASGEGGSAVTDSAAVELVLSMLTYLDHPGHTLARAHVTLSGLASAFGFPEEVPDLFFPKRRLTEIMRIGLAATMADWVRHPQFRQRCTAHDQVRCEQLVELARHWDASGGGRLSHFVERVRSQRLDNPISSRVRVMTIHGAKGLEFEAVILADLQSSGGRANGPSFVVTATSPERSPEIHLLPSRADAAWLNLQELHDRHQQRQFEEDLSVLYVALTRAKSFLDVVITAPKSIKPSLANLITESWGHCETGTNVITERVADASGPRTERFVMNRDAGLWESGNALRLTQYQPAPHRLAALTPSGQEGAGIVKLSQVLNISNNPALERGTAIHALLSRIEWNDQLPSLSAWAEAIPEREANPAACRQGARELHPRLQDSADPLAQVFQRARWMEQWKDAGVVQLEVWRERRFAAVLDSELMNGSFDRVVFGLDATGRRRRARILDFKTDRIASDEERETRRLFYQPQLDAYARAIHQLTGLPPAAVQTQLVWIN